MVSHALSVAMAAINLGSKPCHCPALLAIVVDENLVAGF
jgi:hypothetical protein